MQIARAARRAIARANQQRRSQWAAVCVRSISRDVLGDLAQAGDRFYWERPSETTALAASGCLHEIVAQGSQRFRACAHEARDVFSRIHSCGPVAPSAAGPLLVGGFGFSERPPRGPRWQGFPPARLVLPATLSARTETGTYDTVLCPVEPGDSSARVASALEAALLELPARGAPPSAEESGPPSFSARSDRSKAAYRALVEGALAKIASGELEKVVLARSVAIRSEVGFEAARLLGALRGRHPSCASFAIGREDATFLGATPESLLRLSGGRLSTAALAGSALRGRTPEADAALARDLIESKKEQAEHAIVVRAIREALAPHCRRLDVPESPTLLALESIQHLETRITGELAAPRHLLELAAGLHPTPAVGGAPREAALAWLSAHEELERGWYAGAVGYVDAEGGGELAVALRSGLIRGARADLFAGAGIVTGSKPEAELAETRLKLRSILTLLLEL